MLLRIDNLNISLQGKNILSEFKLELEKGEKVGIRGMSGVGKSTLINAILGFINIESKKIYYKGEVLCPKNISMFRSEVTWLPQNVNFSDDKVKDFINHPFTYQANRSLTPEESHIAQYFDELLLDHQLLDSTMDKLSGGEKQRIALITCLLLQRDFLLLDEPTASLDQKVKKRVAELVFSIPGITILTTSHDEQWLKYCDRIIDLKIKNLSK